MSSSTVAVRGEAGQVIGQVVEQPCGSWRSIFVNAQGIERTLPSPSGQTMRAAIRRVQVEAGEQA